MIPNNKNFDSEKELANRSVSDYDFSIVHWWTDSNYQWKFLYFENDIFGKLISLRLWANLKTGRYICWQWRWQINLLILTVTLKQSKWSKQICSFQWKLWDSMSNCSRVNLVFNKNISEPNRITCACWLMGTDPDDIRYWWNSFRFHVHLIKISW